MCDNNHLHIKVYLLEKAAPFKHFSGCLFIYLNLFAALYVTLPQRMAPKVRLIDWTTTDQTLFALSLASDIWSLGVILFMLVCGQPPFQEANDSETLTMIMDCKYTVPAHVSNACEE